MSHPTVKIKNSRRLTGRFADLIANSVREKLVTIAQELKVDEIEFTLHAVFSPFRISEASISLTLYPQVTRPWGSDKYPECLIFYNDRTVVLVVAQGVNISVLQSVVSSLANTKIHHHLPRIEK